MDSQVRRFVLRFLYVQLLERIFRAEEFLNAAQRGGDQSNARVIAVFRAHLKATSSRARRWVARVDEGGADDDDTSRQVLRQLLFAFNDFDELHLRLGYVGAHWSGSDIGLFVQAVFGATAQLMKHAPAVNVVPSDRFMFEETTLDFLVGARTFASPAERTPTVLLPKVEFSNPLNWCPLVHEFGHSVYPSFSKDMPENLRNVTVGGTADPSEKRLLDNWLEETFCDLLATKLLGPAYLASFIDFVVSTAASERLESATLSHPDVRFRVVAMQEALRSDGVVARFRSPIFGCEDLADLAFTLFEERAKLGRFLLGERDDTAQDVPRGAKTFRRHLIEGIEAVLPQDLRVAPLEERRIQALHKRLAADIPIASCRRDEFDQTARESTVRALDGVDEFVQSRPRAPLSVKARRQLAIVTGAISEQPCTVAEILNAAWLYKWERIYEPMITRGLSDSKSYSTFYTDLKRLDAVTRTSIETAYLAREFRPYVTRKTL